MNIILCCGKDGRAVIFGRVEAEPVPGDPVRVLDARMVLYWDRVCGGLLGLASGGPSGGTRITAPVTVLVETVWQEWLAVSDEAAEKLYSWEPCHG